jgi:CubicO group peptidase (beta-lactamase class C family)
MKAVARSIVSTERIMDRRSFLGTSAGALGWFALPARGQDPQIADLSEQLEAIRKEHGLPGIAAAAVRGSKTVAEGVGGVRRVGELEKITPDDRFGMASCTKVMTQTMVLRLIDAGRLGFDTTLAEALPDIAMRDDYRQVTVAQLLLFQGGIHPYMQFDNRQASPALFDLKGTAREKREQFVRHVLQEAPVVKPGTERRYSNASYALAGYVADRRTGKSWEALMQEEVFIPLDMTQAGFGRPRTKERPNEPALHRLEEDRYVPEPEDRENVAEIMAPAGNVHCSIRDFARFAAYELNASQGDDALLKPATRDRWQELSRRAGPLGGNQKAKSKGGAKTEAAGKRLKGPGGANAGDGRSFSGGSAYISTGCVLWPSINLAIVVAINAGGAGEVVRAALEAIKQREGEFAKS